MNLKEKIIEKFYEEPKIFRKINANSAAKLKLIVIEDIIEIETESCELEETIKQKVADFDSFYKKTIKDGKSILKNKIIEEYSVLKFFASESIDNLLEYANKISSNIYDKKIEIKNVLTGEKVKLNTKTKKMYLQLINNLINTKYKKQSKTYVKTI